MAGSNIVCGREIFDRYADNPILTAADWPYAVHTVFNPGAAKINGDTVLLCRVEDYQGFSHLTVARSEDGFRDWEIDEEPTLTRSEEYSEEQWGLEDPRIVWHEDMECYVIAYTSYSPGGPQVSLATTTDFKEFRRFGATVPPEDKDASIFPKKIGDRYALIHRPIVRGEAHIWLSLSPDLVHWGEHRMLIPARGGHWDSHKVGLGPQPILTEEGWLIIYHGVRATASGRLYRVGLALLDIDKPWKVLARTDCWVFGPSEQYEFMGDVPGVVFPTGATVNKEENRLNIYYGAADSTIGVATAKLSEVLEAVREE